MPSPHRLLLVDDSPTLRMLATAYLTAAGHAVDAVEDGAAAVEAVRTRPYDLVLMDILMPGLDGLEATRAIRALPPPACALPIVALTADDGAEDRARCLAAGMNDHIGKPLDRALLLETVARWLTTDGLDGAVLDQLARDLPPDLLPVVLGEFVAETLARAGRIAAGADTGTLAREAHTLKSTAATFGAARLSAAALELERACRGGGPADAVAALTARIPQLARDAVEAYRARGLLGGEAGVS